VRRRHDAGGDDLETDHVAIEGVALVEIVDSQRHSTLVNRLSSNIGAIRLDMASWSSMKWTHSPDLTLSILLTTDTAPSRHRAAYGADSSWGYPRLSATETTRSMKSVLA
jgi:hypothetical protein